jgi:hypothetical protein
MRSRVLPQGESLGTGEAIFTSMVSPWDHPPLWAKTSLGTAKLTSKKTSRQRLTFFIIPPF